MEHVEHGAGSHDFEFSDVFVPEDLTFMQADALANRGASLALGIARHALDVFVELASTKVPTVSRSLLRERISAQAQLGARGRPRVRRGGPPI